MEEAEEECINLFDLDDVRRLMSPLVVLMG